MKSNFKNPISQILGLLLQRLRIDLDLSSKDIAKRLGLSESAYRMIEAGSAGLNPGRTHRLLLIFDKFEFGPFSKLLIALQVMGTEADSIEDCQEVFEALAETDDQLKTLAHDLNDIWLVAKSRSSKEVMEFIRTKSFDEKLADFLIEHDYYGIDREKLMNVKLNHTIENTPSIFLDYVLKSLSSLNRLPLKFSPEDSREWERENKDDFVSLVAIISNQDSIISKDNLETFDYLWLWSNDFKSLRYIFLNSSGDNDTRPVKDFSDQLIKRFQKNPSLYTLQLSNFQAGISKVEFLNADKSTTEKIGESLKWLDGFSTASNLWIFTMKNGNKIGFVSSSAERQILNGVNLNFNNSKQAYEHFNREWDRLSNNR